MSKNEKSFRTFGKNLQGPEYIFEVLKEKKSFFTLFICYKQMLTKKVGGKWSLKYKRSINCKHPKGFSQRQHCKYGRRSKRGGTRRR